jgi:hypothetical protein
LPGYGRSRRVDGVRDQFLTNEVDVHGMRA